MTGAFWYISQKTECQTGAVQTLSNLIIIWKTEIRNKKTIYFFILFKYNIFLFKQLIFHFLKFALSLKKKTF